MPLNYLDTTTPHEITIASYNFYPEEETHPDRIMTEHDLFIVIDGEWEVSQDGLNFPLSAGDAIFLFANKHHYGLKKCSENTRTIFIHFKPNEGDCFGVPPESTKNYAVFPTKLSCKKNPTIMEYFAKLVSVFWAENDNKKALLNAYTTLLICGLGDLKECDYNNNRQTANEMLKLINNNLSRFYTTQELSDKFYISTRKVVYLLKVYTRYPPHPYQLNMHHDRCDTLLKTEPELLCRDLADRFGFYDEFHFSKLYKLRFGHSPKKTKPKKV